MVLPCLSTSSLLAVLLKRAAAFMCLRRNRGQCRRAMNDLQGCIEDFDAALALDPQEVQCFAQRGHAFRRLVDSLECLWAASLQLVFDSGLLNWGGRTEHSCSIFIMHVAYFGVHSVMIVVRLRRRLASRGMLRPIFI
eukprot:1160622-Pelagomonas_calceolata.AAC.16